MKQLKMLGLAAVAAMALMAFFGASSASAGVLCKTHADPCGDWDLKLGDTITASLTSGAHATFTGAFTDVTCKKSHISAKVTNTGGKTKTVIGEITELTFTECLCDANRRVAHVNVTFPRGTLELNDSTEVIGKGTQITFNCTGLCRCEFGTVAAGTKVGTYTESETGLPNTTAELHANATLTWFSDPEGSSQFICAGFGDTAKWEATYQITSPDPLYHSAS